ncbi:hypothetical protein EJA05_05255 [Pseudomonas oryziphila]|uniref:Uncharacterized protein n=1 Tax=Pseudomonas entomophila TaxID=312306 RepID=A0A3Q8TZC3_9PSED|nr:hypothetical protein EJA05_05255 [Pseudomonas oryziphila]
MTVDAKRRPSGRLFLHVSPTQIPVGAGLPANQATRYLAPATPVFAGKPAPTGCTTCPRFHPAIANCSYSKTAGLISLHAGFSPTPRIVDVLAPPKPPAAGLHPCRL